MALKGIKFGALWSTKAGYVQPTAKATPPKPKPVAYVGPVATATPIAPAPTQSALIGHGWGDGNDPLGTCTHCAPPKIHAAEVPLYHTIKSVIDADEGGEVGAAAAGPPPVDEINLVKFDLVPAVLVGLAVWFFLRRGR